MGEEFIKLISDAFSNTEEFTAIEESEFMTDREKEVVLMYYRDKKSPTEIAVDLELSRQRIHQLRNSALVGVRTTLSMVCMPDVKRREFYTTVTEFEDLSNQSKNALMRNKITTPSDIIDYIKKQKGVAPEEAIMKLRNIGRKSAEEICGFLKVKRLLI
ncbi:hypothetical protein CE91St54_10150 [Hungatella hathewayi]|jgi:predicted DNA-binding protein YlxM (UPF0122 family)|uniref:RNA polymerase sigma-70 region 4 domain-containing protein n=1 Tax=Hungatella hathewayi TaxID=154046 RepID=A0AA37JDG9_9FIRM|nr:sigma factor-like helix-turn-helix DNA-binding protein [Hungatella hathewayi]GKG99083.1 hypothetical protein CE91St55_10650 [Hungatella hathewayi]GKH05907.1 hypothetical protein CE91St54_10150 [Hungatella hathewayi]DAL76011.1 MAG TPA: DNA-directed RNA polymerase subunit alpha [Caudoviricetes sp.]